MKKLLVIVTILLIGCSSKQTSGIGYDKVGWGTTVKEVKKMYPNGTFYNDCYIQKNLEGKISQRTFEFDKNKLCRVVVSYSELDEELKENLYNNLVLKYGEFDKFVDVLSNSQRIYFRNYHKNLVIRMRVSNVGSLYSIKVEYFDPIIYEQNDDIRL